MLCASPRARLLRELPLRCADPHSPLMSVRTPMPEPTPKLGRESGSGSQTDVHRKNPLPPKSHASGRPGLSRKQRGGRHGADAGNDTGTATPRTRGLHTAPPPQVVASCPARDCGPDPTAL